MASAAKRATYHHGDLPAALVEAALELIEENGVRGFSVAEAARRTGVSISAPYRHFADRDELLAACATAACEELRRRFEKALALREEPTEQLAAVSAVYVRFAAERRAMFEVLVNAGLDKSRYPNLQEAAGALLFVVVDVCRELAPDRDERAAGILVQALTSLAQGHATMLLDGGFGELPAAIGVAERRAAAASGALLLGRELLFSTPTDG